MACAHEPVRLPPMEHRDRICAVDPAQGGPHGVRDVALVRLLHEMRQHLRVGLGAEAVTTREQAVTQVPEVLDDAVVDDRHVAGAVDMGVRVQVVGTAVGGPAGMGKADGRLRRRIQERGAQVGQLAGALLHEQLAGRGDQGDARGVVAAVLQAGQAVEQDGRRVTRSDVSDDATHALGLPQLG